MKTSNFELILSRLQTLVDQSKSLEKPCDTIICDLIAELPALYRLFHRVTFDTDINPQSRQKSASIAVYISEQNDYRSEFGGNIEGLMDDAWLAYTGLEQLASEIEIEAIQKHWKSEQDLQVVISNCKHVQALEKHISFKVLDKLNLFLQTEVTVH